MQVSFERNQSKVRTMLLLAAAMAALAGCSRGVDVDRVPTHPVQGSLTFNGEPIPGALVVLHPRNAADPKIQPARGNVGSDGKFIVSTYDAADGAAAGEYAVTVEWYRLIHSADSAQPGPNVLPPRYANPQTTDLIVRINEGANDLGVLTLKR